MITILVITPTELGYTSNVHIGAFMMYGLDPSIHAADGFALTLVTLKTRVHHHFPPLEKLKNKKNTIGVQTIFTPSHVHLYLYLYLYTYDYKILVLHPPLIPPLPSHSDRLMLVTVYPPCIKKCQKMWEPSLPRASLVGPAGFEKSFADQPLCCRGV